jgi:hypothetical protein
MKSNNYLVTYDDLSTMGLTQKTTAPTGNRIATKSFLNTYYYINNSGNIMNYANNQCVPYQNIVGSIPNSATLYYNTINTSGNPVGITGVGDSSLACSLSGMSPVTAYYYGTFNNGTNLFYDNSGTQFLADGGWFNLGGYSFQMNYNAVYNLTGCASCNITGTTVINPTTSGASGTIYITGTKSVRFSCFGGGSTGNTFSGTLNITGVGSYFLSCTAFQTKNTDISLSAGTYSFSITRGSYTGSSGNNASITCL